MAIGRIKKLLDEAGIEYKSVKRDLPRMDDAKAGIKNKIHIITLDFLDWHNDYIEIEYRIYKDYLDDERFVLHFNFDNMGIESEVCIDALISNFGTAIKKIIAFLECK